MTLKFLIVVIIVGVFAWIAMDTITETGKQKVNGVFEQIENLSAGLEND